MKKYHTREFPEGRTATEIKMSVGERSLKENIIEAATDLVFAQKNRKRLKQMRNTLMSVEGGFCENFHGDDHDEGPSHCWKAQRYSNEVIEFCGPCRDISVVCEGYYSAARKAGNALRRLTRLIEKREALIDSELIR